MLRRYSLLLIALCLAACQGTRPVQAPPGGDGSAVTDSALTDSALTDSTVAFTILQINDVYEISPLDRGRVGGMARVATVLRQLEAENPNTIAVIAGDFVSPSLIGSLSRTVDGRTERVAGAQMVEVLNAVGLDYATFGNHEFDISEAALQARLDESAFAYVSANVRHRSGGGEGPFVQRRSGGDVPVPGHVVHVFRSPSGQSVRLGLVGVTLPFNRAGYVAYDDVYAAAGRAYAAARAESDVVFALTHLSIDEDVQLARAVPGFPLVMGGHEHEAMLVSAGATHITKADANARTVYVHRVVYDPAAGTVRVASELVPVTDAVPDDPATARVVARWEAMADSLIGAMGYDAREVVATFDTLYDGREASIRNFPTNLGRLVASAMRAADPAAGLALVNSGSIRIDDQITGAVQQRDVLRILPFGGPVVHARLSGDVLRRVLDVGLRDNRGAGGYLQTAPAVTERDSTYLIGGVPLDPAQTYEVVLPEFVAQGRETGLGFLADDPSRYTPLALQGVDGSPRNDLRDVVIRYLKEHGP